MSTRPNIYKQHKVVFSIAGVPVDDIAEDEEITIEYDRDRISKQLDIHEGGIFSLRSGKPAKITVPILQHSKWISRLDTIINAEQMIPITLEDRNEYGSRQSFIGAYALVQDPNVSFGSEASSRSYVFEVIHLQTITAPELE